MADETTLRIFRGDSQGGEMVDYTVPVAPGMVVLDAIHAVQAQHAPDLAVRWNCKAGRCGSCSAEVNGRPRLTCMDRIDKYPASEPIVVRPMKAFPVIKDLATDVSWNYRVNKRIPAFQIRTDRPRQFSQAEADRADRVPLLKNEMGLGYCNITKCCTEVCPESIHITDNAIIPLKERVVDRYYDPIQRLLQIVSPPKK
jgi:succinate dehydrogenase / fumarate reductase iron-sulfur subunit